MEAHRWIDVQVVHGPVQIGDSIYRAVEAKDNYGGHLKSVEVWADHQWRPTAGRKIRGASFPTVLSTPMAPTAIVRDAGVPDAHFPEGYRLLNSPMPRANTIIRDQCTKDAEELE